MDQVSLGGGGQAARPAFNDYAAALAGAVASAARRHSPTPHIRFRKDRHYLLNYYLANFIVIGAATALAGVGLDRFDDYRFASLWFAGLILFVLPNFWLIFLSGLYYLVLILVVQPDDLSLGMAALVPAGVLAGTVSAALMHNAAHGNFRRRWANRAWGEACGLFQLTGFAGWCISHFIHHAAPDDPDRDPHPPGSMTFSEYANAMGTQMKANLTGQYYTNFGHGIEARATWSLVCFLLPFLRYLRVAFALVLLGPAWFVMLYVPFKIANSLIYVDFNYRTHRPTGDGGTEVLNLDHTVWYRLLNAISFGSYYHRNHHRSAGWFNPRYAPDNGQRLITYRHG